MTRIVFYSNLANKQTALLGLVLQLVQQALEKHQKVTILAENEQAASQINSALWQHSASSFLPNVLASHPLAAQTPVLVDWQEKTLFQDDILINLTQRQLTVFSRFRQLVELVTGDAEDKVAARERYKFYRDRGYEIQHIEHAAI